jgi:formate hydrogenlyase transcriptional activator
MTPEDANPRQRFEGHAHFESLLVELSSRFINLAPGDVDREIEVALRRVCEFVGIDRAVLWQWSSAAPDVITPTHAYFAQGALPPAGPLRQEQFPWFRQEMLAGRIVRLSSVEDLPAEAAIDLEFARHLGIKSNLTIPLSVGGERPVGALGLNTLRAALDWPDALVTRLQLVAQVFTNALARRRADEVLRENQARLSLAADAADAGLWTLDYPTGLFWVTDRARTIFGYPPDEPITMKCFQGSVHPDDWALVLGAVEGAARSGDAIAIEYRIILPGDRGVRWISSRGRPRSTSTGEPECLMGVSVDVTERRRAEEALRQSLAEIARLKDRLQAESEYLKAEIRVVHSQGEVTGHSAAVRKILRLVEQVAPTDSSVLIRGETGTGKELVAQAIHRLSPRGRHVMVKVNCAALPSGLVESELFGREKGAFTGALSRQVGRFEVADGSTIFLDEVGELPPDVQVKLLRVLQEGEFERLGSPRTVKVNVRLIAATNRDLADDVRKGRFREDLYYRLNVFPIRVPPLRERAEDIPLLVWTFLEDLSARMGKKITQVPRATMEALQRGPWPGNVRELRNVIEHAAIITSGDTLNVPMLGDATPGAALPRTLADAERDHILFVLESTGGRIKGPQGAAAVLGLNPATLYSRMKKLGVRPSRQTETGRR